MEEAGSSILSPDIDLNGIFSICYQMYMMQEREEIFPVLGVSSATIVFTLNTELRNIVWCNGRKNWQKVSVILLQQRCSALYYSLHWGELCGSACVYTLQSLPAVLCHLCRANQKSWKCTLCWWCSAVVACYLIMGAHRVHEADQKQASCKEAVGLCLKNKLRK